MKPTTDYDWNALANKVRGMSNPNLLQLWHHTTQTAFETAHLAWQLAASGASPVTDTAVADFNYRRTVLCGFLMAEMLKRGLVS